MCKYAALVLGTIAKLTATPSTRVAFIALC